MYDTWQSIVQQCMAQRGFEYYIAPFDIVDARPRLPTTLDEVVVHGYNPIEVPLPVEATHIVSAVENDPAFRQAFIGDPDDINDGCRDEGVSIVEPPGGEFQSLDAAVEHAQLNVQREVEAMDAYSALDRSWSECMKSAGYTFERPGDALGRFVGTPVDQNQIDARISDLNCQASISYEFEISQLILNRAQAWIDTNADIVSSVAGAKRAYLEDLVAEAERRSLAIPSPVNS